MTRERTAATRSHALVGWAHHPRVAGRFCAITSERPIQPEGYAYETACGGIWVAGPPPLAMIIFGRLAGKCEKCAPRVAELERLAGVQEVQVSPTYARNETLPHPFDGDEG